MGKVRVNGRRGDVRQGQSRRDRRKEVSSLSPLLRPVLEARALKKSSNLFLFVPREFWMTLFTLPSFTTLTSAVSTSNCHQNHRCVLPSLPRKQPCCLHCLLPFHSSMIEIMKHWRKLEKRNKCK